MLIGSGRMLQFPAHVRGALANGVTREELRELVLHAQLYCGIPVAVEATALCEAVFNALTGGRLTAFFHATILHLVQPY